MSLIRQDSRFDIEGRNPKMNTTEKIYNAIKSELTIYENTFFSRKAAAPICIALCCMIIIVHVLGA